MAAISEKTVSSYVRCIRLSDQAIADPCESEVVGACVLVSMLDRCADRFR